MTAPLDNAQMLRQILESSPDCVKIMDLDARLVWMNGPGKLAMQIDLSSSVAGAAWLEFWQGEHRASADAAVASALAGGTGRFSGFCPTSLGEPRWWDVIVTPLRDASGSPKHLLSVTRDISEAKRDEQIEAAKREILVAIAAQEPLPETLDRIAQLHQSFNPDSFCSLQVMDASGRYLLRGAAPSLPESFNASMDGLEIGLGRGSAAAAAWSRESLVARDIASDPNWAGLREIALAQGLRACWSTPVLGNDGQVLGTFSVYYREPQTPAARDRESIDRALVVTRVALESARLVDRLRERDHFFELSLELFCIFDSVAGRFTQVNRALGEVTGFSAEEMTSRYFQEFVHPDDRDAAALAAASLDGEGRELNDYVVRFLCRDGGYRWLQWSARTAQDGLVYAAGRDITEQKKVDMELAHAVSHDAITGLPHHLVFERKLAIVLDEATGPVWILFIGLDHFQSINESMGHGIGDELLLRVAERLRAELGDAGGIARFAGDEFVVAVTGFDQASVLGLAERLRDAISKPIQGGEYQLLVTASVGISQSPDHGRTPQELLRRAEAAMTRAKRQGRDCVREFSTEQMQDIEDRLVLGSQLRGAVARGELELHYQPQHRADDRSLCGFEALLRWNNPSLGRVPPSRFVPVAEALGLMSEIGAWVLDEACRQARVWLDCGHRGFDISVNVAAQQLQRTGLVAQVRAAIERHALPKGALTIELTESSLMENVMRVQNVLAELKALGIQLSLDDFGTGYSSLAYLKQFPFDKLKIDQSFVRGLPGDGDDATIARTIVAMAHQLRLVVAAEGVETPAQALFLKDIGCDELQGYLLGRPVPATEAEAFFRVPVNLVM